MDWTADLAYVVGLITTDGCLSSDGRHIIFVSKDLQQINNFQSVLNLSNKIGLKGGGYSKLKKYYYVQFSNVKFYRFLISIGLSSNKSKTIGKLLVPDQYFIDFLRGHLDGDGCTYSYFDPRWKNSFMLYTVFISASKLHLEWIQDQISRLYALNGKLTLHPDHREGHPSKGIYNLRYAKMASLTLLNRIYYSNHLPTLERKRFKIEQSLAIINAR